MATFDMCREFPEAFGKLVTANGLYPKVRAAKYYVLLRENSRLHHLLCPQRFRVGGCVTHLTVAFKPFKIAILRGFAAR